MPLPCCPCLCLHAAPGPSLLDLLLLAFVVFGHPSKIDYKTKQKVACACLGFILARCKGCATLLQVGVIKLSGFNARAQQDVAQAVRALTKHGASEFTLDVRDNRGGLYQEGAEVAKLFLEGIAAPHCNGYPSLCLTGC